MPRADSETFASELKKSGHVCRVGGHPTRL